jgi:hypothetical protein
MGDKIGTRQFSVHLRGVGRGGVGQPAAVDFVAVAAVLQRIRQAVEGAEGQPEDAVGQG